MSDTSDQNKANTIEFFMQVFNQGDVGLISSLLSPDYKYNGQPSSVADNVGWVNSLRAKFPGLQFSIESILAEDDKVALRWRLTVQAGFTMTATNILTFVGGKAVTNDQTPAMPDWSVL